MRKPKGNLVRFDHCSRGRPEGPGRWEARTEEGVGIDRGL